MKSMSQNKSTVCTAPKKPSTVERPRINLINAHWNDFEDCKLFVKYLVVCLLSNVEFLNYLVSKTLTTIKRADPIC